MDKAITTALLIVISMVMALMLFNVAYPAVIEGGDSMRNMANRAEQEMKSDVTIIHTAAELDNTGWWQDTNGNGDFEVFVWVKNTGSLRIIALEFLDIFFGPDGAFMRIPSQANANGLYPYWTWEVEGGTEWTPAATLRIAIHYEFPLATGHYFIKVTTPNGVADDEFMGI